MWHGHVPFNSAGGDDEDLKRDRGVVGKEVQHFHSSGRERVQNPDDDRKLTVIYWITCTGKGSNQATVPSGDQTIWVYLYEIDQNRMTDPPRLHFEVFKRLWGNDYTGRVLLVATTSQNVKEEF